MKPGKARRKVIEGNADTIISQSTRQKPAAYRRQCGGGATQKKNAMARQPPSKPSRVPSAWRRGETKKGELEENTGAKTDDNGNAMLQSFFFQFIQKRNRLKIHSYRRYGGNGEEKFVFLGLFIHVAVRGGTFAFTLKIVNTLINNSSRDDMPSIST